MTLNHLTPEVLEELIARKDEISNEELHTLAYQYPPDAWVSEPWDWAHQDHTGVPFTQFIIRMMRSLDESDDTDVATSLAAILHMVTNWTSEETIQISLNLLVELFNKKVRDVQKLQQEIIDCYSHHPDVDHSEGSTINQVLAAADTIRRLPIDIPDARLIDDFLARAQ